MASTQNQGEANQEVHVVLDNGLIDQSEKLEKQKMRNLQKRDEQIDEPSSCCLFSIFSQKKKHNQDQKEEERNSQKNIINRHETSQQTEDHSQTTTYQVDITPPKNDSFQRKQRKSIDEPIPDRQLFLQNSLGESTLNSIILKLSFQDGQKTDVIYPSQYKEKKFLLCQQISRDFDSMLQMEQFMAKIYTDQLILNIAFEGDSAQTQLDQLLQKHSLFQFNALSLIENNQVYSNENNFQITKKEDTYIVCNLNNLRLQKIESVLVNTVIPNYESQIINKDYSMEKQYLSLLQQYLTQIILSGCPYFNIIFPREIHIQEICDAVCRVLSEAPRIFSKPLGEIHYAVQIDGLYVENQLERVLFRFGRARDRFSKEEQVQYLTRELFLLQQQYVKWNERDKVVQTLMTLTRLAPLQTIFSTLAEIKLITDDEKQRSVSQREKGQEIRKEFFDKLVDILYKKKVCPNSQAFKYLISFYTKNEIKASFCHKIENNTAVSMLEESQDLMNRDLIGYSVDERSIGFSHDITPSFSGNDRRLEAESETYREQGLNEESHHSDNIDSHPSNTFFQKLPQIFEGDMFNHDYQSAGTPQLGAVSKEEEISPRSDFLNLNPTGKAARKGSYDSEGLPEPSIGSDNGIQIESDDDDEDERDYNDQVQLQGDSYDFSQQKIGSPVQFNVFEEDQKDNWESDFIMIDKPQANFEKKARMKPQGSQDLTNNSSYSTIGLGLKGNSLNDTNSLCKSDFLLRDKNTTSDDNNQNSQNSPFAQLMVEDKYQQIESNSYQ